MFWVAFVNVSEEHVAFIFRTRIWIQHISRRCSCISSTQLHGGLSYNSVICCRSIRSFDMSTIARNVLLRRTCRWERVLKLILKSHAGILSNGFLLCITDNDWHQNIIKHNCNLLQHRVLSTTSYTFRPKKVIARLYIKTERRCDVNSSKCQLSVELATASKQRSKQGNGMSQRHCSTIQTALR